MDNPGRKTHQRALGGGLIWAGMERVVPTAGSLLAEWDAIGTVLS
jgi:hypothetical protein